MKVLCSGDHHWDHGSRWDECRRVHDWMFDTAVSERVDLFISCGDIYERASTPEERIAVAEWLCAMAEQSAVLIVKGNHDSPRDLELLGRLDAAHPIVVEESAGVHLFCHSELAVAAMAWPERARLLARARTLGMPECETMAQDSLRNVLRGLGSMLSEHKGPTLAVGHFMVSGAQVSTGQPLVGAPLELGLSDLELLQAPLVIMGHVHKPQAWSYGNTEIVYVGSPYRTSYGELEDKSAVLVDFGYDYLADRPGPRWRRALTPCSAMHLVDDEWEHGGFSLVNMPAPADVRGAELRFRYAVAPDERAAARAEAALIKAGLLEHGAVSVLLEECVRTTSIARAPEVAAAKSLGDKLQALWTARGVTPESPRREALLEMAAQLEAEV